MRGGLTGGRGDTDEYSRSRREEREKAGATARPPTDEMISVADLAGDRLEKRLTVMSVQGKRQEFCEMTSRPETPTVRCEHTHARVGPTTVRPTSLRRRPTADAYWNARGPRVHFTARRATRRVPTPVRKVCRLIGEFSALGKHRELCPVFRP